MKLVIRTVIFHLLCIFIFAIIYFNLSDQFLAHKELNKDLIDFMSLSTTIQAGVGITNLYPISVYTKTIVMIQQMIMLFGHVITIYIFTL